MNTFFINQEKIKVEENILVILVLSLELFWKIRQNHIDFRCFLLAVKLLKTPSAVKCGC